MNLLQFARILLARWKVIALLVALGALGALGWAIASAPVYRATAQVLVNVRAPDTVGAVGGEGVTPQLQPDYLTTQIDVIRSDRVAQAAVKRLGLTEDPQALQQYRAAGSQGSPTQYFSNTLRVGLRVLPSNASRVISIDYLSANPQSAAAVANAFAEAYRDVSLDLQVEPAREASGWYEKTAADLRKQLATAQEKLDVRRQELGVTGPSEQADAEDARLAALSQQLAGAQAQQALQSSRAGGGALPDAMASPVVQALQTDIARLEAQRQQLATFAGPNNVDYRQVTNQLTTLRQQLAQQRALVARSASASSAQGSQNVRELQAALGAQKGRVLASQRARGEISALEQDVTNLKSTYEQLVAKQAQSNLLGAASQTNISVLSPASVPTAPAGIPPLTKILLGILAGGFLGILLALALEFLDQRLRVPEDASTWLGIPNLGGVRTLGHDAPRMIGYAPRRYLPRPPEGSAL